MSFNMVATFPSEEDVPSDDQAQRSSALHLREDMYVHVYPDTFIQPWTTEVKFLGKV